MATKKKTEKPAKKAVKALFKFDLMSRQIVSKGEVIEVSEERAKNLIERGFCEEV